MVGYHEYNNKPLDSIKGGEFPDGLSGRHFLKKASSSWV
jgi:hypothetical protein